VRRIEGGVTVVISQRLEAAGFLAAFTERTGGVSHGPFATLNVGLRAGDDPGCTHENRRRVAAALGIDGFACVRQVHGDRILAIDRSHAQAGYLGPRSAVGDADGLVTTEAAVALAVLTADCVPVGLAEPATGRLAVVHAGWRGVAAGIVDRAIGLFTDPGNVVAAVGPAVGPDHYEVGEDVAAAVAAATDGGAVIRRTGPRHLLDLPGTVARRLEEHGVRDVEREDVCTACADPRFFSHRRDGPTGRQALVAVRLP
jgi:YfiH family protein